MIDSHCHLADAAFEHDAEQAVTRAREAGVQGALCVLEAGDAVARGRAAQLAAWWPTLRFSVGVHPHHAAQWADRVPEALRALGAARDTLETMRAVGEIGLDYHYDFSPPAPQRDVFAAQVQWAVEHDLPIVVHSREADDDTIAILREAGGGTVRGVMHCFAGSLEFARRSLDLGFFVSFAGIVTFPRAEALREVARFVPGDRLLVETDCPYLAPVPFRGKRNEPAWVVHVATRVAEVRGTPVAVLEEQTTANYHALFRP